MKRNVFLLAFLTVLFGFSAEIFASPVTITSKSAGPYYARSISHGSGVQIDPWHILTSAHVVREGSAFSDRITICWQRGDCQSAFVQVAHPTFDLAVLKLHEFHPNGRVSFGTAAKNNESVWLQSLTQNNQRPTLQKFRGNLEHVVQLAETGAFYGVTDIIVNKGQSGSGVYNQRRELIGITTFRDVRHQAYILVLDQVRSWLDEILTYKSEKFPRTTNRNGFEIIERIPGPVNLRSTPNYLQQYE